MGCRWSQVQILSPRWIEAWPCSLPHTECCRAIVLWGRWVMAASKTQHGSAGTDEILTVEEIEDRYPSEWVLIEDPEVNQQFDVIRGKVIWHSPDRDAVDRKAIELRPRSSATIYT